MSTIAMFGLLVSLAFIAGGCFGYAATSLIDTMLKDRLSKEQMVVSDFTTPELDYFRANCNFVNNEVPVFELRSQGKPLEEIAETLDMSLTGIFKISQKVNKKIKKVL